MSIEKLVKDLKNGGGLTRAKAAALGKLGDKGAIRPLIDALQDNNAGVRNNAAFALGELEAKEAVPQLAALLNDTEEWARKSAAKALGMIGSREAVGQLVLALEDPSYNTSYIVRKNAVRSLGQIGGAVAEKATERAVAYSNLVVSKMRGRPSKKYVRAGLRRNFRVSSMTLENPEKGSTMSS